MTRDQLVAAMRSLFGALLDDFLEGEEYAFTPFGHPNRQFRRVAYAVNLTPETAAAAASSDADLLLTHHDAWDFLYGMKEQCHAILHKYGISHCFVHLPLDYAAFGTWHALLRAIGVRYIIQSSRHWNGRSIPGIGEFDNPMPLDEVKRKVEAVLGEHAAVWKHHDRSIKRVGVVTGAGHMTDSLRDAVEAGCDLYITGEKSLYTVQYARQAGMDLIVGSHTYTERPGIRSLAERMRALHPEIELIELPEPHDERGDAPDGAVR